MSQATSDLLRGPDVESGRSDRAFHPDFAYRVNIHTPLPGEECTVEGTKIKLEKSEHCLGSVQASVELSDGRWVGYSGDFGWPLDRVIKVDVLVVDATYGDPMGHRNYTQADAEEALAERVQSALAYGPVQIIAHGGVAERALHCLHVADILDGVPILTSSRLLHSIGVHSKSGYSLPPAIEADSPKGAVLRNNGCYMRFWAHGQSMPNDVAPGTRFILTKYRAREVLEEEGSDTYRIGFSNHADFDETMKYVDQTGAKLVLTDPTRSSFLKAKTLAEAIERELEGVEALPARPTSTLQGHV